MFQLAKQLHPFYGRIIYFIVTGSFFAGDGEADSVFIRHAARLFLGGFETARTRLSRLFAVSPRQSCTVRATVSQKA